MTCDEPANAADLWPAIWGGVAGIAVFVITYLLVWALHGRNR